MVCFKEKIWIEFNIAIRIVCEILNRNCYDFNFFLLKKFCSKRKYIYFCGVNILIKRIFVDFVI